jgi:hypothetical protein
MSESTAIADQWKFFKKGSLLRFIITVILTTAGVLTAYHTTIYGLREDLNRKADLEQVTQMDSRLVRIETILNERMATKAELQQTRDYLYEKLTGIEAKLQMLP